MTISIGSDHAGYELKQKIIEFLEKKGKTVIDHGTHSLESVDYPDFAHPTATSVEEGKADLGILICGSANGVAMTANKHQNIRAAICWNPALASLAREHNNANIICLPARFINDETAFACTQSFLDARFEGGRHERRVNKIACGHQV